MIRRRIRHRRAAGLLSLLLLQLSQSAFGNSMDGNSVSNVMEKELAITKALRVKERQGAIADALQDAKQHPRQLPLVPVRIEPTMRPMMEEQPSGLEAPRTALPSPEETGQVRMVIDGQLVKLSEPIMLRDGLPLVPLRAAALGLFASFIDLGGGKFQIVLPTGETKTVAAMLVGAIPMVTLNQLEDYFSVRASYDAAQQAVFLETPGQHVQTSIVEKSEEQFAEETAKRPLLPRRPRGPSEEMVPTSARPTYDLYLREAYSYRRSHPSQRGLFRTLGSTLTGRAFDFAVSGESVRKDIGGVFKHDFTRLNLTRPDLQIGLFEQSISLAPLRGQNDLFKGVTVTKSLWDGLSTSTVSWGQTENTTSAPHGTVKYLGDLYEARQELVPAQWLRLRSGVVYVENEADLPEQQTLAHFPRNGLVSFGGGQLDLPHGLSLIGDLAHSEYEPDDLADERVQGWDWRGEATLDRQRLRSRFIYEYVGDQYASVGDPRTYNDFEGWNWNTSYRMTNAWSLNGSVQQYRNNVDNDDSDVTTKNQSLSIASYHQLSPRQFVNLSFSQLASNPGGPDPGSANRGNVYRIDYNHPLFFDIRLLHSYQYYHNKATVAPDTAFHTIENSLFKSYGKGSSIFLSQLTTKRFTENTDDSLELNTSLNWNHRLHEYLSTYLNASYNRSVPDVNKPTDTLSGATGLRFQALPDTLLEMEYSADSYNLKQERWGWPTNWSVLFLISQGFHYQSRPAFGGIQGEVFEDLNGNGRWDPDEAGVGDATLKLRAGREATTNEKGHYAFARVAPGSELVALNLSSLDPQWTTAKPKQQMEVRRFRTSRVDFPLVKAASISGHVFIDANGDQVFQDTEEPIEEVAVIMDPGDQFRRTDSDGVFLFDYLLPGHYSVHIHEEDLPAGYELSSSKQLPVDLAAGDQRQNLNFAVHLKAESVQQFTGRTPSAAEQMSRQLEREQKMRELLEKAKQEAAAEAKQQDQSKPLDRPPVKE